jgi:hypothetical protein
MERAKRAVKRFRAMLPGLNGYVRAISGRKDLSIVLATGQPRTDGKRIFFEPPIELGDDLVHDRRLCDKRDPESYQQLCQSCAVRETLLIKIYHEIAHNLYGTFQMAASGMELKKKIYEEINKLEPKYCKQIQDKLWNTSHYVSYQELAAKVNPFLPVLVNALEDLRVDESMFKARRGTRAMFYAMTREFFVNGVKNLDGSVGYWKDMPLNSQVLVGIFIVGTGYAYEGWFDPRVEKALGDETIQKLAKDVDELESSLETFERAFPILQRLRELGFCLTEEEYDEKEQQDDGEESDDSEQDSDSSGAGDSEPSDKEADQADSGSSAESAGSGGDPEDNEGSDRDGESVAQDTAEQVQDPSSEVQSGSGADGSDDRVADPEEHHGGSEREDSDSGDDHGTEFGNEDESGSASGA